MKKYLLYLFCFLSAMSIPAAELLHYDFQTYTSDGKMQDLSGREHHGTMKGAFTTATADDHQGLFFNGKDTAIFPARPASLKISGDMSIAVTFRITPEQGNTVRSQSPLIFGSNENTSLNRNYSLFFDFGKHLCLNISDGIAASTYFIKDVNDGKLHTAIIVIAYPQALFYLDHRFSQF